MASWRRHHVHQRCANYAAQLGRAHLALSWYGRRLAEGMF